MMRALAENPLAIAEGAPGAPRIAIDVDSQTAIATDETDTTKRLAPDGSGSVEWVSISDSFSATGTNTSHHTGSDINTGVWIVNLHIQGGTGTSGSPDDWGIAQGVAYL